MLIFLNNDFFLYKGTSIHRIYLLKQNRVTVPDEIHEGYAGKNIYRKSTVR